MVESARKLVRPIVTLVLTGAAVYGFVVKLISADVFIPLVTMVFTFWFVDRTKKKEKTEGKG